VQPDTREGAPALKAGRAWCVPPVMPVCFPFHGIRFRWGHRSKSFTGYRALYMEKPGNKRSSTTQATRKKMHQLNDETSLVFTESLRVSLCHIAKSARPTAMPIDTPINR